MPTPYVDNTHTLLTSTPQYLGKVEKILVARADDVGFSKLAHKCKVPRNWQRSQP